MLSLTEKTISVIKGAESNFLINFEDNLIKCRIENVNYQRIKQQLIAQSTKKVRMLVRPTDLRSLYLIMKLSN